MKKRSIINKIRAAYETPVVVRGSDNLIFTMYGNDVNNVYESVKECKDIVESLSETIKFDILREENYIEYEIVFKKPKHSGVTAQEAMDNMNDACMKHEYIDMNTWIDLDIDNLPERFFTRDDIEIEAKDSVHNWSKSSKEAPLNRVEIIMELQRENETKYRYRIQEKKPIQIDKDIYRLIESNTPQHLSVRDGEGWFYNGRQIIID